MNKQKIINWIKKTPKSVLIALGYIEGIVLGSLSSLFVMILHIFTISLIGSAIIGMIVFIRVKPTMDECLKTAYDKLATVKDIDFMHPVDTYVYDKDGNTIGIINAGKYEYVDIENISMNIQNAYICQEDKRFKEHCGIDFISLARAGLALVKNNGNITQGGSTITQQVVKNTFLTQEQTFKRKIIEVLIAPQLEKKYSKPKIMEFYCNTNYYGNQCYGVEAASKYYFGKSAADVDVAEAALLVSLSNSPSRYDPVQHPEASLEKRNEVIENLRENEYITDDEAEKLKSEELCSIHEENGTTLETYQSSYAIHCAALELMKQDGFEFKYVFDDKEKYDEYKSAYDSAYAEKVDMIRGGGYKIYTSLDSGIQASLQEKIDSNLVKFTELQSNGKYAMQGAAVVADNTSGYIVAIVGGRGTSDIYNRAYLSARQPGSSIKPLLDYAPAIETGLYYPSKVVVDEPIKNGPKNSGGGNRGRISLREAVNRSINTIAWKVLSDIGVSNGLSYLDKMQFQKLSYLDYDSISISLGGFTYGTRVVDMAKGYQTLANNGIYTDKTCILDIKNQMDESVLKTNVSEKNVYSSDTAYMMTDILKDTINQPYGTGHGLALNSGMPAAGKTGTTNANKDTWFCGYTRYYTTAVWVGYDTPRAMPGIYGATYAGKIWKQVMDDIHTGLELKDWDIPETVYFGNVNTTTGEVTSASTGKQDLFSFAAEEKAAVAMAEENERQNLENAKKLVINYEASTISTPEETYTIDENFKSIRDVVLQVSDAKEKESLYFRISKKYEELNEIKKNMEPTIKEYEKEKKATEDAEKEEKEKQAAEEREKFAQKTKELAASNAISKIEKLTYRPSKNSLVDEAKQKVDDLFNYSSYVSFVERLENATKRLSELPSESEYNRQQVEKKALEEQQRQTQIQQNKQIQEQLNNDLEQKKESWKGETTASDENGINKNSSGPAAGL